MSVINKVYKLIFQATNTKLGDHTFLFQGAGEASIGIANLIAMAMEKREGIPFEEGLKKIWLKDSKGLIVANRSSGGITHHKVKNISYFIFSVQCLRVIFEKVIVLKFNHSFIARLRLHIHMKK